MQCMFYQQAGRLSSSEAETTDVIQRVGLQVGYRYLQQPHEIFELH